MTLPVTPFNMHTDLVIAGDDHDRLNLTGKSSTNVTLSVWITSDMADRLGSECGLSGPPAADPHAPTPPSPYNMHTDAQTKIDMNQAGTKITIDGPADPPTGPAVELKLSITGPALSKLMSS